MKAILFFLTAVLLGTPSTTHAAWDCLPTLTIPVRSASTVAGDAWAWWCKITTNPDGSTVWMPNTFTVLSKSRNPSLYLQASLRVASAADPLAQANAEMAAVSVSPPAGSQDEYEMKHLAWLACGEVIKPPLPAVFAAPPQCGAAPVAPPPPPPPPAETWLALGGTIFTVANNKLSGVTARKATAGAPCNSSVRIPVATLIYMPLVGGPVTEATACQKR